MTPGSVPADRYGRRPAGRGVRARWIALAAAFAAVAVAWAAWVVAAQARSGVRWQDGAFARLDDGHARLTFRVSAPPGRAVVCTVRMLDGSLTEVGRVDVPAGPSSGGMFEVTATVPTFQPASGGNVRACAVRS